MIYNKSVVSIFFIGIYLLFSSCLNDSVKITGKVQNGLDGSPIANATVSLQGSPLSAITNIDGEFILEIPDQLVSGFKIKEFESGSYLISDFETPKLTLVAEKESFHALVYPIGDKIDGLVLGVIPKSESISNEFHIDDYMASISQLDSDVKWENIIDGVRTYHEKRLQTLKPLRERYWDRNYSSVDGYSASIEKNRIKLRSLLGAIDDREPITLTKTNIVAESDAYTVCEIQWTVLKEIEPRPALQDWSEIDVPTKILGEGLLLTPKGSSKGFIIAIPDADQDPETLVGIKDGIDHHSQFARRLAENGYTVAVPVIVDRTNQWSRGTNRTSRSWIYAQAYEMGRTIVGYEVQKMEALIDWFIQQKNQEQKIGIAGYGEGGLLAFYTAALDTRVDAALVSGYFAPREEIWKEPIYRNIWGLLEEFGDAEIASLIAPRSLVVEYSEVPLYDEDKNNGEKIDPPGSLWTHSYSDVRLEFDRISSLTSKGIGKRVLLKNRENKLLPFGSEKAVDMLIIYMGDNLPIPLSDRVPVAIRESVDNRDRMGRMVEQMVGHTQLLLRDSEYVRREFVKGWDSQDKLRNFFREEMIGWTHHDFSPINPKSKKVEEQTNYVVYEILIDVLPNVQMWGVLLIPKNIRQDEKRPVVVMQHGRGGNPYSTLVETNTYHGISRTLAEEGFVVFSPFGNWTGETRFRWIDRVARPVKNTLWSTVGRQHQQLIRWLNTLPFVDSHRIGIYGKSIGGQAASLISSMLPEYALSINCAYFNEGARKESSVYFPTSFVFHVDSEMPMWNRGHTLQYAEMANTLIFPRPFMVEHGKADNIAPPGWVEHEYAKVYAHYSEHGKAECTTFDHHENGHIINGVKSIPFLQEKLDLLIRNE